MTVRGLLSTLVSNRDDLIREIQIHYFTNPHIRPVKLEKRLKELNKEISDLEQKYRTKIEEGK